MLSILVLRAISRRRRSQAAIAALVLACVAIPGRLLARGAAPETGSITSISPLGMVTVGTPGSTPRQLAFLVRDRALVAQLHVGDQVAFDVLKGTGHLGGRKIRITHMLTYPNVERKPQAIQRCRVVAALLNIPLPTVPNVVSWKCSAEPVAATGQYLCRCIPTFVS